MNGAEIGSHEEKQPLVTNPKQEHQADVKVQDKCKRFLVENLCFCKGLKRRFGCSLLLLLFAGQHLVKGVENSWVTAGISYIFRDISGVSASQAEVYKMIISMPWAMKPLLGVLSDFVPLCGYSKRPYLLFFSVLGAVALALVGAFKLSALGATSMLFLVSLQTAAVDLLTEATYAEQIRHPDNVAFGPKLISFVWLGIQVAMVFTCLTQGAVIQYLGTRWLYVFCIPFALSVLVPGALHQERRVSDTVVGCLMYQNRAPAPGDQTPLLTFQSRKRILLVSVELGAVAVLLALLGVIVSNPHVLLLLAVALAGVVCISFFLAMPPTVAKVSTFFLLNSMCAVSVEGASFYFYTDNAKEFKNGPHFTPIFYTTIIGLVGAIFGFVGVLTYQCCMTTWRYRPVLLFTSIILVGTSLTQVVIFKRWNLVLHIPDELFVVGSDAMLAFVAMMSWMPGTQLLSCLCPPGVEATMFALLAGSANLGFGFSRIIGACLLTVLRVSPSGAPHEDAQFENLWLAQLICCFIPLLSVAALPLIPNARQTDNIEVDWDGERCWCNCKRKKDTSPREHKQ